MPPLFASNEGLSLDDVVHAIGDAVCVSDRNMVFVGANLAFARFYGLPSPEDVLGKCAFDVYPDFKQSVFYDACHTTVSTGQQTSRIGYSANQKTWFVSRCYPLPHDRYAMVVHKLTDDIPKTGYVSQKDPLTSLPNRWSLEADLVALANYPQSLALAMIDIDHFKKFNEAAGFEVGDRALMEVGSRLMGAVSSSERVYRIGNDQFVVLATQGPEQLATTLSGFLPILGAPLSVGDNQYVLTFTMGLAAAEGDKAGKVLRKAEIALNHAKEMRIGYARYVPEMDTGGYDPALTKQIRDAIKNDELALFFQPQVDLIDGKVCGAEVLVRWLRPGKGMVQPPSFLPFAEETGLIQEIDRVVVSKSFQHMASQRAHAAPALPLSVNLSAQSICDPATIDFFKSSLAEYDIDASQITIEITETSLMRDVLASQRVAEALKTMGFKIAIDDFGSGYSSMSYLIRYPSQFLKIDRDFTSNLLVSNAYQVVVKNIIGLAHGLGIGVVAEGVETLEQEEVLRAFGCDVVQGFLHSPALPFDQFWAWATSRGLARMDSDLR